MSIYNKVYVHSVVSNAYLTWDLAGQINRTCDRNPHLQMQTLMFVGHEKYTGDIPCELYPSGRYIVIESEKSLSDAEPKG